jgi:alpha-glucosidase
MLSLYRRALLLRPSGAFAWRESPPDTLVFERDALVCAVNIGAPALSLPQGEVLLASEAVDTELPPGTAAWVRR